MTHARLGLVAVFLISALYANAQQEADTPPVAPPRFFLFVHQQIRPGKATERQRLEITAAQGFDRLNVPLHWIEAEALTGVPEALFLDPFESFEDLEKALSTLARLYAQHPDLARTQQEIEELLASSRSLIGVRRDDLSPVSPDFSKVRFLRTTTVQAVPGAERDARPSFDDCRCIVYEVNAGAPGPAWILLEAMETLKDADEPFAAEQTKEPSGPHGAIRESNLYMVSPAMSHVSQQIAAGDPEFWKSKGQALPVSVPLPPSQSPPSPRK